VDAEGRCRIPEMEAAVGGQMMIVGRPKIAIRGACCEHEFTLPDGVDAKPSVGDGAFAVFSKDLAYRYLLGWEFPLDLFTVGGLIVWVMLNPSVATQEKLDATLIRCASFSQSWGHSSMLIANLFAEVETESAMLGKRKPPVGPHNDYFLAQLPPEVPIVCGWGSHPLAEERAHDVTTVLRSRNLFCLGKIASGQPAHPLYIERGRTLQPWP
jgi:hypothetical protein